MFNIKVFPDFMPNHTDNPSSETFRKELLKIRDSTGARYINASFHNYNRMDCESVHFITYPLSWISHYVTQFYSDTDPLLRVDFRTATAIDWTKLYLSEAELKILNAFASHGLGRNAITVVHNIERDLYCALSATFDSEDANWNRQKPDLLELLRFQADRIARRYQQLFLSHTAKNYKITPRESDCLYWVAMGKTDDQISALLNIGKWTVNGHLQSAKHKLGSPSRSAAVARAIVAGIINLKKAV